MSRAVAVICATAPLFQVPLGRGCLHCHSMDRGNLDVDLGRNTGDKDAHIVVAASAGFSCPNGADARLRPEGAVT